MLQMEGLEPGVKALKDVDTRSKTDVKQLSIARVDTLSLMLFQKIVVTLTTPER